MSNNYFLSIREVKIQDQIPLFLGNFTVNPNAGLVFVDFEEGSTLQMIGKAKILWDEEDPKNETGGTLRFWEMKIEHFLQIQRKGQACVTA